MQQEFTQKWAVISLLDEVEEGAKFYYTDFPAHITLAGIFAIDKTGLQLANELGKLVENIHAVEVIAEQKAMFGPQQDIAVMTIQKSPDLLALYSSIYEWLRDADVAYNSPEYQGEGYIPHSTLQKGSSLHPGEHKLLTSVSLIDAFPNNDGYQRKIFKTINLVT